MQLTLFRTGLIAAAIAAVPVHLSAQATPAAPATPASAPVARPAAPAAAAPSAAAPAAAAAATPAAPSEAAQIQSRLAQIQQRAMQDPAVQASAAEVTAAMEAADPEYKALSQQAQLLKADIAAAQTARDNARLNELAAAAQKLQSAAVSIQGRVSTNPGVQAKTTAYRNAVFQKMMQLEPETQALLARLAQLRG